MLLFSVDRTPVPIYTISVGLIDMNRNRVGSTTHRSFRLSVFLILSVLTVFGVMPPVSAELGCLHACCLIPAGTHMHHQTVRISAPSQPSCCATKSNDTCQFCTTEEMPPVELACQTVHNQNKPSSTGVPAAAGNLLSNAATHTTGGSASSAAQRGSPPLYIQTLSLLI